MLPTLTNWKKKKKYKLKMIKKNRYKMGKIGDILQSRCGFDTNEMRWNKKKVSVLRMILEYVQKNI